MTLDDLCSRLLPPDAHLHFEPLLLEDHHITLIAAMTAPKAVCPDCHQPSQRMHSGYPRTLADLPWAMMPVELVLHVRRFFCDTAVCGRLTFAERLPTVAAAVCPHHDTVAPQPGVYRLGPRGRCWCPAVGPPGHAGQSEHGAQAGARSSHASLSIAARRWHRRLGLAQRPPLRHHRGRSGARLPY